jgi:peptide methionine sulfoxide reductase MsrB
MAYNQLTIDGKKVIEGKGTEIPFSSGYDNFYKEGTYVCRKCNIPFFPSKAKFEAGSVGCRRLRKISSMR